MAQARRPVFRRHRRLPPSRQPAHVATVLAMRLGHDRARRLLHLLWPTQPPFQATRGTTQLRHQPGTVVVVVLVIVVVLVVVATSRSCPSMAFLASSSRFCTVPAS